CVAPQYLAGGTLDAAQLLLAHVRAGTAVKIAVMMDRRIPMAAHAFPGEALVRIGPEHVVTARLHLEERTADAVTLGNEDTVTHHDGIAGVDAFKRLRPPGEMEIDFAVGWIHADQPAACEDETPAPAVDGGQNGPRVTRQFVGDLVFDFAGEFVEGDDAAAVSFLLERRKSAAARRTAANLHDQQIAFDHRCAADAEEVLDDTEVGLRIDLPDQLAVAHPDAVQHALCAE